MMLYGPLIEQFNFESSVKDKTGMGRWVYMTLRGRDGIVTRIVCGYNSCNSKKGNPVQLQTTAEVLHHKRKGPHVPENKVQDQPNNSIKGVEKKGDRLIVCMDINEDIYRKSIGKSLTESEDLLMVETVGNYTGIKISATFFRGS